MKDRRGRRPTIGERAVNWAKVIVILAPVFGAGWVSNTETVKSLYQESPQVERGEVIEMDCPDVSCPPQRIIEKTIVKDCSISEAMKSHEKAYHE